MIIRPLHDIAELEACVTLQRAVWRFNETDLVPRRMFVVADKIGGQVLGAFHDSTLAGYSMALPGLKDDGTSYWHSHMLAVAPGFRNQGLGRQLKLRQREEALARNLRRIEWTFDPLEIKNAYFNLVRLGAIARRYVVNQYGLSSSTLQAGLPTDRLIAEWWLDGTAERGPAPVTLRVTVPAAVAEWKAAADPRAAEIQRSNRDRLQGAFAQGLAVTGFERRDNGDGVYLLSRVERP